MTFVVDWQAEPQQTFRVWYSRHTADGNPPGFFQFYVDGPKRAREIIDLQTIADLKDRNVTSNVFGLQELEAGEWNKWYDDDGLDVCDSEQLDGVTDFADCL